MRETLEADIVRSRPSGDRETILLLVDNLVVFYIVNNMVSSSPSLMSEPRRLHNFLQEMKVEIQAVGFRQQ